MTTAKCPQCSQTLPPGARFCATCGADISAEQAIVTTANVPIPSFSEIAEADMFEGLRHATLGEYDIKGELGRGGMAIVYLAHDIGLDRKVAIKVMSPALVSGEGAAERFRREAKTAASLSHPHIIPIFGVRETERAFFFVMKYIAGRPLDSAIKKLGPLPIKMVSTILSQVGTALEYAHQRGVIHRDIKPANIIIDDDGWAIVMDFGIAKLANAENLTATGAAIGTPAYMSPEQCSGKGLDGKSDQYSLGIVAYEMITGRQPFAGQTVMEILKHNIFDDPAPIAGLRPDCPPEMRQIVEKMLAKDPADRWESLDKVVSAIGAVPLSRDDPVRTQMVELAKSGAQERHVTKISTPVSPPIQPRRKVEPTAIEQPPAVAAAVDTGGPTELLAPTVEGSRKKRSFGRKLLIAFPWLVLLAGGGIWGFPLLEQSLVDKGVQLPWRASNAVAPAGADAGPTGPVASAVDSSDQSPEDAAGAAGPPADSAGPGAQVLAGVAGNDPGDAPEGGGQPGAGEPVAVAGQANVGYLVLQSTPAARVRVDGEDLGTRREFQDTLPPGNYDLAFSAVGYVAKDTSVQISAGETATLSMTLRRLPPGQVGILVADGILADSILVDGRMVAELTDRAVQEVPAGSHRIRVTKRGYAAVDTAIAVRSGQLSRLTIPLQPTSPGVLQLVIENGWGEISLNGVVRDSIDRKQYELDPGTYRLRIRKDGFAPFDTTVTLRSGDTRLLRVTLLRPGS